MIITLWGTRGSVASSGPETQSYGGNTSCVEVYGADNTLIILDAGTGILRLGSQIDKKITRVDLLLTHLHLDHIQGLGFFVPFFNPNMEVHVYGPARSERHFRDLLATYLSPPLFPVLLSDLPCQLFLHELLYNEFQIGQYTINSEIVSHPGLTLGYRISSTTGSMAYIPDHEPALGMKSFPSTPEWTSGYNIAANVDILIHDTQYSNEEYQDRIGWGHSTFEHALAFGQLAKVKKFITFHHDPSHSDEQLDKMIAEAIDIVKPDFEVLPGLERSRFEL